MAGRPYAELIELSCKFDVILYAAGGVGGQRFPRSTGRIRD